MRGITRKLLVAAIIGLGFWQLGQGAYIPAKAWLAQELMQRAWVRSGNGEERAAPWPWADTWPVARFKARNGEIDLIVLAGGSGRTLAFGPGHLSASVLPGNRGNSVIAGHRDTHFRFLQDVEPGEKFLVESSEGVSHRFAVIDVDIVDSRSGSIALESDAEMLSLITCYPFDAVDSGGPLRYVVTARKIG